MNNHYHGSPIWGGQGTIDALYKNGCALVSFARPEQLKKIIKIAKSVIVDNGAFSIWKQAKKANKIVNWNAHWAKYYAFILAYIALIDWFIIPDVIEGTEEENDKLIEQVPTVLKHKAVPVWHSVESIERLVRLCEQFPRVAIGFCGEHETIRGKPAQDRLTELFDEIYVKRNIDVKIHGLRMLDGRVLGKFPLDSGDSTNIAINVPKWIYKYPDIGYHIVERWCKERGYKFTSVQEFARVIGTDAKGKKIRSKEYNEFNEGKEALKELKVYRTAVLRSSVEQVKPPTIEEWRASRKSA